MQQLLARLSHEAIWSLLTVLALAGLCLAGCGPPPADPREPVTSIELACRSDKPKCHKGDACVPENPCHLGTVLKCRAHVPVCGDTGIPVQDGTSCGADLVCFQGGCQPCAAGDACTPQGPGGGVLQCRSGVLACTTGQPVCLDAGPLPDGTACSAGTCLSGVCVAAGTLLRTVSGGAMAVDGTAWTTCVPNEPVPGASRRASYAFGTGTFTLSDEVHPSSLDCTGLIDPGLGISATASILTQGDRVATWIDGAPAGLPASVIATAAFIHDFDMPAFPPSIKWIFVVDDLAVPPVLYTGEGKDGPVGPDGYPLALGSMGRTRAF